MERTSTPSPVQAGIDPQCTTYAQDPHGTFCTAFATTNNIAPSQLYAWNPILGANGADCSTEMFAGYYYCVGVAPSSSSPLIGSLQMSTVTTTTMTTVMVAAAPGPTQSGITAACNRYAQAVKGDGCGTFATEHGIQEKELYAWNAVLGSGGENCGMELWAGEFYCVGVEE